MLDSSQSRKHHEQDGKEDLAVLNSHVHLVQYIDGVCTSMQYLQPSVV